MKDKFRGYYHIPELESLFDDCKFVFDTNVLLAFYELPKSDASKLFSILEDDRISDQLWIPYHVGFEYQKNRVIVIKKQDNKLKIEKKLTDASKDFKNICKDLKTLPWIQNEYIDSEKIKENFEQIIPLLDELKLKKPNYLWEDSVRIKIDELFSGKIGETFSNDELTEFIVEGEYRFENKIPPGYADTKKTDNKYGDLIIWKQMIHYAKLVKKPIIFVTNDKQKRDWIFKDDNNNIRGPQAELVNEFFEESEQLFHILTLTEFIEEVGEEYLGIDVEEETVENVDNLSEEYEQEEIENEYLSTYNLGMIEATRRFNQPNYELIAAAQRMNQISPGLIELSRKMNQINPGLIELARRMKF